MCERMVKRDTFITDFALTEVAQSTEIESVCYLAYLLVLEQILLNSKV